PILRTNLSSTAKHLLRDVQRFYRNKGKLKTSRSISVSSCDGGESSDSEKAPRPRLPRARRRVRPQRPRRTRLPPTLKSHPPLDATSRDPKAEPLQSDDAAVTNFVTPIFETPPPKVPPRPPVWIQSQSSVSTCGSVEFCTPPSSPRIDAAKWCSSECIT
ncbi:hypothetical protein MRX96_051364, partial [Rhipicephalus microplus]